MGSTANGYPWPDGSDLVRDGDDAIRDLAEALDPGVQTLTVTPAAGWTFGSGKYAKIGPTVRILAILTRTGAAITASAAGDVTPDVAVFTALPAILRPTGAVTVMIERVGVQMGWGQVLADGSCNFTHGLSSASYPAAAYTVSGGWILGF